MTPKEYVKQEFERLVRLNDGLENVLKADGNANHSAITAEIRENVKLIIELAPIVAE